MTSPTTAEIQRISSAISDSPRQLEPRVRRSWSRLRDADRAAVAAHYAAGETSTALAAEYGVAKSTILGILRANNVVVRRQPLAPEQVSEATRLYESGLSLSQVAQRLKVNQETMRVAIIAKGSIMRKTSI